MIVLKPVLAKWVIDTRMERRSAVQVPGLMRLQPGRKNPQSGSKETGRRAIRWWSSKPIDRREAASHTSTNTIVNTLWRNMQVAVAAYQKGKKN